MSSKKEKSALKKLSRQDLLEMLIEEEKHIDRLEKELAEAREALKDRQIQIQSSGSIAEAALKLNEVFEAAQAAADQYLENIKQQRTEAGREGQ